MSEIGQQLPRIRKRRKLSLQVEGLTTTEQSEQAWDLAGFQPPIKIGPYRIGVLPVPTVLFAAFEGVDSSASSSRG